MDKFQQSNLAKLNPFAFPDETETRFILLIAAAIVIAAWMGAGLVYVFMAEANLELSSLEVEEPSIFLSQEEYWETYSELLKQAVLDQANQYLPLFVFPMVLVSCVFLGAYIIYRQYPNRIQRRQNLDSLTPQKDALLYHKVQELIIHSEVDPVPAILIGKDKRTDGQAFGIGKRAMIRLGGQTRLLARKRPAWFRVLVLHELAHIANRDIGKTYYAQALWIAVTLLAILPFALASLAIFQYSVYEDILNQGVSIEFVKEVFGEKILSLGITLLQIGAVLLVVFLVRAGLLQAREYYADWRANLWGVGESLAQLLQQKTESKKRSFLRALFSLHPSSEQRLDRLKRPLALFAISHQAPFFAGVLIALMMMFLLFSATFAIQLLITSFSFQVQMVQEILFSEATEQPLIFVIQIITVLVYLAILLPFLIMAILVGNVIGVQVTRQALSDLVTGSSGLVGYLRLALPAGLFLVGMETGFLITPLPLFAPRSFSLILAIFLWALIFVLPIWLVLAITRFVSSRWLSRHTGNRRPQNKQRLIHFISSLLLMGCLIIFVPVQLLLALPEVRGLIFSDLSAAIFVFLILFVLLCSGLMAILAIGWLFFTLVQMLFPLKCPACGQVSAAVYNAGNTCNHCHRQLTPWLFIK